MNSAARLILASASPRRQAFLRELGLEFSVVPADIDETPLPHEDPVALAARLARTKAEVVAAQFGVNEEVVVIAADTVVAMGHLLLGKPEDEMDARRMLRQLRATAHEVHSAVSVVQMTTGLHETVVNTTTVWMRDYSDHEVTAYVESGDPMDKAGAYAIQHPTFDPAQKIRGCLSGVIGLPLGELREMLSHAGVAVPNHVVAVCEAQTRFGCCQR